MIQFNLLPDIKIAYIKARRQKRIVLLASVLTIAVCVAVMVVFVSIAFFLQKKSLADLSSDIKKSSQQLEGTTDLNKMLTVQNQLKALPALHDAKPVVSRIFGYITQSTPSAASIARLNTDFSQQIMTLSGATDSLETVNTFIDTLKFTTYHTDKQTNDEKQAFSNVVLAAYGRDAKGASYTITLKFDPIIFSETDEITLTVPKKVTTRSETEQPTALFQEVGQ